MFTILLTEDDPEVRAIIGLVLEDAGYEVLSVANVFEALRLLADNPIDLLITDIVMPSMNGFELAHQAKLLKPDLILIYITGYFGNAQLRAGPIGTVLRKPFRPDILLTAISEALEGRNPRGTAPQRVLTINGDSP